ncbi:MAG: thioether cross-link-forming SCIFF peptide maturase [Tissierellales bacterium]|nr:thioether cross-link-forming SCIFF peptide maturase [Tissierellales bacterium]MBN2827898.1 thioether cross-link-forming SCIFF peptide maturase [Tissierellales bacterium]
MIHLFELDNKRFVIDINSGLIHEVDAIVYDILRLDYYRNKSNKEELLEHYSIDDIEEACQELQQLEENQMLYTKDLNLTPKIKPILKAMCLNIAHDCNLSCGYCFASQGDYDGKRSLMSYETGKKALDYILHNSGSRTNLEVDFFGGEPLMNFEVVKKLVLYGREEEVKYHKNFRFTITTNGVLLDEEKMMFINEHFDNIVMSIDGRKKTNDNVRKTLTGQGSYDVIVPKFKQAVKLREDKTYFIRGTFTGLNLDFSEDLKHLRDLGFKSLSMEPVVTEPGNPYEIKASDLDQIKEEYEKLYYLYKDSIGSDHEFNFFHYEIDLENGPCIYKRISGCGAGNEYIAVTPEGEIYPCHQFVGNEDFIIGTLDEGITRKDIQHQFHISNVLAKEACRNCWAKYFCSGGCDANAYNFNHDFLKPYEIGCEMEKKRIECAIRIKAEKIERKTVEITK